MGMQEAQVGIAGLGAVSSALGANKASKEAARQAAEQQRLQQMQLDFARKQYEDEQGYIRPIRDRLTAEAMSEQPLDYARMRGQIEENYANAARKFMGQRGGLASAAQRGLEMGKRSSMADAYGQGLTARRNLQQGLLARDQSAMLGSQYGQALGGMAAGYGRQADMMRGAAQQGWGNFATGLGNVAYGLAAMKPSQGMQDTTTLSTPTAPSEVPYGPMFSHIDYGPYPGIQNTLNIPYGGR